MIRRDDMPYIVGGILIAVGLVLAAVLLSIGVDWLISSVQP